MNQRRKKAKIPAAVRNTVWQRNIIDKNNPRCYCCQGQISANNWHCGHIISEHNGGNVHLKNLRPICMSCNCSMGTTNMHEFMLEYGFDLPPDIEKKRRDEEIEMERDLEPFYRWAWWDGSKPELDNSETKEAISVWHGHFSHDDFEGFWESTMGIRYEEVTSTMQECISIDYYKKGEKAGQDLIFKFKGVNYCLPRGVQCWPVFRKGTFEYDKVGVDLKLCQKIPTIFPLI